MDCLFRTASPFPNRPVRSSILYLLASTFILLTLAACDTTEPDDFEQEYVVEAYLVAQEPLPQLRLTRTAPLDVQYDANALAVRRADVRVVLLAEDGTAETTYLFDEDEAAPGVYRARRNALVQPLRTYRLEIDTGDDRIRGETTVPDTFELVSATTDTVVYQSTEQLEFTVTRSRYPGRDQSFLIFVTEALDASEDNLVPFASNLFDRADGDITIDDLRVNGSPILNEANYDANPDGTLTIRFPWIAVLFYGRNHVSANVLDDNLYDFIRSVTVQQGGSTFSPGEIPDAITHLDGALGVFGAYARITYDMVVLPPPDAE